MRERERKGKHKAHTNISLENAKGNKSKYLKEKSQYINRGG
jgi:hypothetical protein